MLSASASHPSNCKAPDTAAYLAASKNDAQSRSLGILYKLSSTVRRTGQKNAGKLSDKGFDKEPYAKSKISD